MTKVLLFILFVIIPPALVYAISIANWFDIIFPWVIIAFILQILVIL